MRVAAVVTAAGSGTRLGHALPKALVPVGGVPLVVHAVSRLLSSGRVDHVVVTVPAAHRGAVEEALGADVLCVVGGPTRQSSVAAGLAAVPDGVDVVLVHDAARAFVPADVVGRVVDAVAGGAPVVVPVVPVTDTVVEVEPDGAVGPLDRSRLRAVQTPQGFARDLLERAHAAGGSRAGDEATAATDDASLCAALGVPTTLVDGDLDAFKVTTPRDLRWAEALLEAGDL